MPEFEIEPTAAGKLARWMQRARILREHVHAARVGHASVDVGFTVVERDADIGGGLLAGALAYRLFVLLLPTTLLLVSGLGLYADATDKRPVQVAEQAGLSGLIAREVATAASGRARGLVFVLMIPAVLYARDVVPLAGEGARSRVARLGTPRAHDAERSRRAARGVRAPVCRRRGRRLDSPNRPVRRRRGAGRLSRARGRRRLVVSTQLPRRDTTWPALVPGAALFGVGLLFINVFNVYITTRLVEGRVDTYGALGIATAILFSLVLVGRLMIVLAELKLGHSTNVVAQELPRQHHLLSAELDGLRGRARAHQRAQPT